VLQHFRKSRESHIGGALDVRGAVASEVAVIDSLHQAQASGALQAGRREHAQSRALHPVPEGDLAPQSCIWTTTTANDERPVRGVYRKIEMQ
jgi:hypothetical protein